MSIEVLSTMKSAEGVEGRSQLVLKKVYDLIVLLNQEKAQIPEPVSSAHGHVMSNAFRSGNLSELLPRLDKLKALLLKSNNGKWAKETSKTSIYAKRSDAAAIVAKAKAAIFQYQQYFLWPQAPINAIIVALQQQYDALPKDRETRTV